MVLCDNSKDSNMNENMNDQQSSAEKHSLYLRFPKKLNSDRTLAETEVKSLNSKIVRVRFPRQRSANFCILDFDTKVDKDKAGKKLKQIEIDGKHLVVKESITGDKTKLAKKSEKIKIKREVNQTLVQLASEIKKSLAKDYGKRNVTNGLIVRDLKARTTTADIKQSFPEAIDIKVTMKPEQKNSFALIWLPTPKAAKEASKEMVQICGDEYVVSLQKDNKSQKKHKNVKAANDNDDSSSENEIVSDDSDEEDSEDVDQSD